MIRLLIAFLLAALCVATWTPVATAQPPRNYPCAVGDWDCVNGKILALESQLQVAQQEARYAAEAARQARDAQRAVDRDAMWSIAGDRVYSDLYRFGLLR